MILQQFKLIILESPYTYNLDYVNMSMNITDKDQYAKLSVHIEYFVDIPETRVVLKSFKFPSKKYCPLSN
jgi:hypothetical protein